MFCKCCGSKLEPNSKFCQNCGSKMEVNAQPPLNNSPIGINNYVPNQPIKKNNSGLLIIMIILVMVISGVSIFMIIRKENSNEEMREPIEENANINNESSNNTDNNNNNNNEVVEPNQQPENTTEVEYGGYTFYLPEKYLNMEYEGNLTLYDMDSTWLIMFTISDSSYSELKLELTEFDKILSESYSDVKSTIKKHQGIEYISTTAKTDGNDIQMIMTDLDNSKILMTLMMPLVESVTFEQLFELAFPIITTVK